MQCRPTVYGYQLQSGDRNGGVNCAAYALADGLEFDSCGAIRISGATVRALTNEPVPDSGSPGLHHGQLRDVAAQFGVTLTIVNGASWAEAMDLNRSGYGILIAVNYMPIRTTSFSGQRTFYGNHELLLLPEMFVHDPLADGRLAGGTRVWRSPGQYSESLLKQAAGAFIIERYPSGAVKRRLGFGRANIAVLEHRHSLVLPDTSTGPHLVEFASKPKEVNVAVTTAYRGHTFSLVKGQPIFRYPGGPVVTRLSKTGPVEYIGKAGAGWVMVRVTTQALYSDGVARPTGLYVPASAGVVE